MSRILQAYSIDLGIAIIATITFAVVPLVSQDEFLMNTLITVMLFALFGASWDLQYGVTGLINLGPGVAYGVGGFALNYLAVQQHYAPALSLLLAGLIAAPSGLIIWLPAVRMSGAYLAIVTLAILLLAGNLALIKTGQEGYSNGIRYFSVSITTAYYGALVVSLVGIFVLFFFKNSRFGLRSRAIKDDEVSAKARGINVALNKLVVVVLSSFFLGLAGAYYALYTNSVNYSVFSITTNFIGITIGVIGGPGTIVGGIIGSLLVEIPSSYLVSYGVYSLIVYGLTLVIVMLFFKGGVIQALHWVARTATRIK
ncbi:MAG: branched-chain amino acid ABC transporter permease [Nitrososphaerales archaeon]